MAALLSVEGLCVGLRRGPSLFPVLDGVSLTLADGRALGLVGESGSGKSLTARALLGLLPDPPVRITSGAIRFRGEDLVPASPERRRALRGRAMAMVFQDPMGALDPVLKVGEQVAEPLRVHRGAGWQAAREAAI